MEFHRNFTLMLSLKPTVFSLGRVCEILAEERERNGREWSDPWASQDCSLMSLRKVNGFCKLVPKLRENFETFGLLKGAAAMAEMGWVFGLGNLLGYC